MAGLWGADYPPGLLYLFQGLGWLYQHLFAPDFLYPVTAGGPALRALTTNPALLAAPIHRTLLRMPAILADLVTGALVFVLALRSLSVPRSLLVASIYWFNPAVIYNSALYGQTDAVHTLLVVIALALVETGRVGILCPGDRRLDQASSVCVWAVAAAPRVSAPELAGYYTGRVGRRGGTGSRGVPHDRSRCAAGAVCAFS